MTERELFNLVSKGGGDVLSDVIAILRRECKFCLIGGLAVNCYLDAVYTNDAEFAVAVPDTGILLRSLEEFGFCVIERRYSSRFSCPEYMVIAKPASKLKIHISNDVRMSEFPARSDNREVLGEIVPVACLNDLVQERIWSCECPDRDIIAVGKDRLDLIRIGLKYQEQISIFPEEIRKYVVSQSGKNEEEDEGVEL